MAWIELHDNLPDHDKVLAVSEALNMDKDLVVGKLVRLWTWAVNNREDGAFKARDISTIAEVMRFKGKPQRLVDALVGARLLDRVGDTYVIHGWDERVGMLLAKRETARAQTRERVKRHRDKRRNADETDGNGRCNALQAGYGNGKSNASNAATVPKPYLKDDDDDEEEDKRARAREPDGWDAAYAEADRVVQAAFRSAYGREPTAAEVEGLSRVAVLNGMTALIGEAVHRAATYGAKSVVSYVGEIVKEWRYQRIDTEEELAEYDYLQDCIHGKAAGMESSAAFERLRAHRIAKGGT